MEISRDILEWFFKREVIEHSIHLNTKFRRFFSVGPKVHWQNEKDWIKITYGFVDGFEDYDVITFDDYKIIVRDYKIKQVTDDFS